jgi:hypothetical protein
VTRITDHRVLPGSPQVFPAWARGARRSPRRLRFGETVAGLKTARLVSSRSSKRVVACVACLNDEVADALDVGWST